MFLQPEDVDIIAYERKKLAFDADMHSVAQSTFNTALSNADYGVAGERTTYGNPPGRTLLEDRNDMKQLMKRMQDKLDRVDAQQQQQHAHQQQQHAHQQKQDAEISDLKNDVKNLRQASLGYRKIRHRFLEVYHRDVLQDIGRQGRQKISEGNEAAHDGDAVTDASLYKAGERSDERVLADLYGLNATQISILGKCQTSLSMFT